MLSFTSKKSDWCVAGSLTVNQSNQHQKISYVQAIACGIETGVKRLRASSQSHFHLFTVN